MFSIVLYTLSLIGSLIWLYKSQDFEPAITAMLALASLTSSIAAKRKIDGLTSQDQKVSKGAIGVQAGRDVNMNTNKE